MNFGFENLLRECVDFGDSDVGEFMMVTVVGNCMLLIFSMY